MGSTRGYYSIVQYCPDASRLETVNIGVALFCPEIRWLKARFGRRRTQISQLFGKQDWDFVALQQDAIQARLGRGQGEFPSLEEFEAYVARRANALTLTGPRPMKVEDPERELDDLLRRLVGSAERTVEQGPSIARELTSQLRLAGVAALLRRDVVVNAPFLPKPLKARYAFQNGRLNLIEPMLFEGQSPTSVFAKVSVRAVEGGLLRDYEVPELGQVGLVVVAKFGPAQEQEQRNAARVFEQHQVPMHTFERLEPLIEQIRHAHA